MIARLSPTTRARTTLPVANDAIRLGPDHPALLARIVREPDFYAAKEPPYLIESAARVVCRCLRAEMNARRDQLDAWGRQVNPLFRLPGQPSLGPPRHETYYMLHLPEREYWFGLLAGYVTTARLLGVGDLIIRQDLEVRYRYAEEILDDVFSAAP